MSRSPSEQETIYRTGEEFEDAVFPKYAAERRAEPYDSPADAGARLVDQVLQVLGQKAS